MAKSIAKKAWQKAWERFFVLPAFLVPYFGDLSVKLLLNREGGQCIRWNIYIIKSYINFAFTVSTFRVSGLIRCECSCVCVYALRSVMPCVHVIEEDAAAFGSFTSAANKSKEGRTIIALSILDSLNSRYILLIPPLPFALTDAGASLFNTF